jgi:hypothetical protein
VRALQLGALRKGAGPHESDANQCCAEAGHPNHSSSSRTGSET